MSAQNIGTNIIGKRGGRELKLPYLPMTQSQHHLPKLLYTIAEAAYILAVSQKTIRRLLERGLLTSSNAIRTKLITWQSIEAFVKMTT